MPTLKKPLTGYLIKALISPKPTTSAPIVVSDQDSAMTIASRSSITWPQTVTSLSSTTWSDEVQIPIGAWHSIVLPNAKIRKRR
jgi:hypothetical protein